METKYICFSCNAKHYLIRESEVIDRWPSISDRSVENLFLKNGIQYRATNIKEIILLDLSSYPEMPVVICDEPFGF